MENELKQVQEYFKDAYLFESSGNAVDSIGIEMSYVFDIAITKRDGFYTFRNDENIEIFPNGTKNFSEILEVLKAIAKIGKPNQQQAFIENGTDCGLGSDYGENK